MYYNKEKIILASGSQRRQHFFKELGISFEIATAAIHEFPMAGENPEQFVCRMSQEKAEAVAALYPDNWIVSGDTVVCLDNRILGKPADHADAVRMLMELAGRKHWVRTGFCLCHKYRQVCVTEVVTSMVLFTDFSKEVAKAYVDTGEPMDKAGAYGIQGKGGILVREIIGSYSNIVGMPMAEVVSALYAHGIVAVSGRDDTTDTQ